MLYFMKKIIFLTTMLLALAFYGPIDLYAQDDSNEPETDDLANINPESIAMDSVNSFKAAFGITQIGDETFVGTRLQPELTFSKFGFGLDIPIQFNIDDKSFRSDEFKGGVEVLRLVRYFRFGRKKVDPVYVRVGDMGGVSMGYGALVNNYTNSPNFESRKFGVNLDINIKKIFGIEALYSDIKGFNLFGIRPYVRPFKTTSIPIVKSLEFGYNYVKDKAENVENAVFLQQDGVQGSGFDAGVTFLNTSFIKLIGYGQSTKLNKIKSDSLDQQFIEDGITNYGEGKGSSFGLYSHMKLAGTAFILDTRIERLSYEDHYLPQFFDAIYEINKDAKIRSLGTASSSNGIYGTLSTTILEKFRITGGILLPDVVSEETPALVQVQLETSQLGKVNIKGSYIKGGLADLSDAFKFDERSLANVDFSYQMASFLLVGVDYKWTFARLEDDTIEATDYYRPYFALTIPLGGGGKSKRQEDTVGR